MKLNTAVAFLAVCGAVSPARAQNLIPTLSLEWTDPPTFNLAACSLSTDIIVTITNPNPTTTLAERTFSVWWQETGDCGSVSTDVASLPLPVGHAFYSGTALKFPADMDPVVPFKINTVFDHKGACDDADNDGVIDGIALAEFKLCFAVDLAILTGTPSGQVEQTDLFTWIDFGVDTLRPPKPEAPTIDERDGSLQVSVSVSVDPGDITDWRIRSRELPEDATEADLPCDQWTSSLNDADTVGNDEMSVEISGKNLVTYQICAFAIDGLGNESLPSDVVLGTPLPSTDFAEGYPESVESGYGCAAATPALPFLFAVPLLWRRRRSC